MRQYILQALLLFIICLSAQSSGLSFSKIGCSDIRYDGMEIHWQTDRPSTSVLFYGLNSSNFSSNETQTDEVSFHSLNLFGLTANSQYYYAPYSCISGSCYNGSTEDCKTLALSPPIIANVKVQSLGEDFASITFSAEPGSNGSIMWGVAPNSYINYYNDSVDWKNHAFKIKDLKLGSVYYFRVIACLKSGCAVSEEYSFKTLPDRTPPVVISAYPSGILDGIGSQIAMGITTNEPSDCRYSNISMAGYYIEPLSFDNSSSLNHSTMILAESNRNYTFYSRCVDISGNPMDSDYVISFSTGNVTEDTAQIQKNAERAKADKNKTNNPDTGKSSSNKTNPSVLPEADNAANQQQLPFLGFAPYIVVGVALAVAIFFGRKFILKRGKPKNEPEKPAEPETLAKEPETAVKDSESADENK